eukprot:TRINITY_DN7437_c0_g1_i1.p1 TRINITY_DN7437_c0_g1~~TRINITY_DN7437_c0_g1_i1.p1  ORF type:complete len:130 (-),score=19.97 TRINITY_DN7437_c0_g1_i1:82-471(-)
MTQWRDMDSLVASYFGLVAWWLTRVSMQKGWTKSKAVKYLLDHSDFPKEMIEGEVDRYVTWPGQAVSYKIGQLEVKNLRDQAERALGDKFDIKQFHKVVLDAAGPLKILKQQVKNFIKEANEKISKFKK